MIADAVLQVRDSRQVRNQIVLLVELSSGRMCAAQ